ncbi:hypothetical protein L7F22_011655 [Adiantum nelumboides]|nr:hypothetical protein [Adiantum nelumboides]
MVDNNIDVFKMFAAEDRLDGDNYPMWAYMMQHVLVSKGVWNIVQSIDVRPGSVDVTEVVDVAGPSTRIAAARSVLPTADVECTYNPVVHDACMSVAADSHVWYFDSGATKHITSHRDLFTSLESVPHGNSVTCANNASYPVQGVGKIVLTVANGSSFTLVDALYVPGIKKNLLSISALARLGLVVKFVDDRCIIHDLNFGDEIVASGILCRGLYKLTLYDKCGQNFANAVMDTKAISYAKLWHARFGHLNFASLLRLQKSDMVASLPLLEAPVKHVCEGCILGGGKNSYVIVDATKPQTRRAARPCEEVIIDIPEESTITAPQRHPKKDVELKVPEEEIVSSSTTTNVQPSQDQKKNKEQDKDQSSQIVKIQLM